MSSSAKTLSICVQEAMGNDFPMWIVYVSQNLTFGGGLLGITYGIVSTSWDPDREGSVSGMFQQFFSGLQK
jgi:hypothetical protein